MKRLFLFIVLLAVSGCTNQEEIKAQNNNETQSTSASSPAESIKNIKNNVQGTLDQIKARDEYQQELAN